MGKRFLLLVAVAFAAMVIVPALAAASLVNEYGMHYAGQQKCLDCHNMLGPSKVGLHSRFATPGLQPGAPAGWTNFKAAGDVAPVAGTGGAVFNAGGTYPVANTWVTLGDLLGGSGTEYLFWRV